MMEFTCLNANSSRSHVILMIKLEKRAKLEMGDLNLKLNGEFSDNRVVVSSTLNLVDLAGSERVKKSKATGHFYYFYYTYIYIYFLIKCNQ